MPSALVTGANGFIGSHLVLALAQQGWRVHKVDRHTPLARYELTQQDVVFHLAGLAHAGAQGADEAMMMDVNAEQTLRRYEQACEAGVGHFVWLSSIKVLGDVSPVPLAAQAPYAPGDSYALSKARGEQLLLAAATGPMSALPTQLSVVRPPLVYGPGVSANFLSLWHTAMSPWPLPLATARAPRAWLGIDNLVSFLLARVATRSPAPTLLWHVCDAEQTSVSDMIANMRKMASRKPGLWPLPVGLIRTIAAMFGRHGQVSRLFDPLPVDDSETRRLLCWTPPLSQLQQLEKVHTWFAQQ